MKEKTQGLLFVVAAPSGAGKTSLCKALMERIAGEELKPLNWSVSYTTRKPRAGEKDGRDYFFVDDAKFDAMIELGEFAEWAAVHGRRYGTSRSHLEEASRKGVDLMVEIDIQGASNLKNQYADAVFMFVLPPDWPSLEGRLRGRGTEGEDEIKRRLDTARREMLEYAWFDYIIINDDFDRAVDEMRSVVLAERSRKPVMEPLVKKILAGMAP